MQSGMIYEMPQTSWCSLKLESTLTPIPGKSHLKWGCGRHELCKFWERREHGTGSQAPQHQPVWTWNAHPASLPPTHILFLSTTSTSPCPSLVQTQARTK